MDTKAIITAIVLLGVMGLFLGAVLAYASKVFHVDQDERIGIVRELLPGANCGGCGKAGCDAMAEAIVKGEAAPNACPVGGNAVGAEVAKALGMEVVETEKMVAYVACKGTKEVAKFKFNYYGAKDCREAAAVQNGDKSCENGCLGYGSCTKVCQFDAISIGENGLACVDPEKCMACGKCVEVCPHDVIKLVPYGKEVRVSCNSKLKGKYSKANCTAACIACNACAKNCPEQAIVLENNLPVIDYSKCNECHTCVEKCKQGVMILKDGKVTINAEADSVA